MTHINKTIAATSTEVCAANPDRQYALIQNDSDTVMYLAFGTAAVANTGIRLNAVSSAGSTYEMSRAKNNLTGLAINAINSAGGKVLCGLEI